MSSVLNYLICYLVFSFLYIIKRQSSWSSEKKRLQCHEYVQKMWISVNQCRVFFYMTFLPHLNIDFVGDASTSNIGVHCNNANIILFNQFLRCDNFTTVKLTINHPIVIEVYISPVSNRSRYRPAEWMWNGKSFRNAFDIILTPICFAPPLLRVIRE